jgi:hypothetical protein
MNSYYDHHIPDKLIKQYLPQHKLCLKGVKADGCFVAKKEIVLFEYENSSRGLLYHTAKYQKFALSFEQKLKIVFIESKFHAITHTKDTELAKFIAKYKIPGLRFKFYVCNGSFKNIKRIVSKETSG